jgi:hypothetical protein
MISIVVWPSARSGCDWRALAGAFIVPAAAAALLLASAPGHAADPGGGHSGGGDSPVKLEDIPGSEGKRVTLTAKAAERLGIETGAVSEEPIVRRQMVGGMVLPPLESLPEPSLANGSFGGFGATSETPKPQSVAAESVLGSGAAWVLVTVSEGEWERIAQDRPARILPLATREAFPEKVLAKPSGIPPIVDLKRSMLSVYYVVPEEIQSLTLNTRVRVELELTGDGESHKVIPYSAVYYDASGATWAYIVAEPLVYERQPIGVERIVGDVAVLTEGPPVGTEVVTVGAPLLYGTEIFGR